MIEVYLPDITLPKNLVLALDVVNGEDVIKNRKVSCWTYDSSEVKDFLPASATLSSSLPSHGDLSPSPYILGTLTTQNLFTPVSFTIRDQTKLDIAKFPTANGNNILSLVLLHKLHEATLSNVPSGICVHIPANISSYAVFIFLEDNQGDPVCKTFKVGKQKISLNLKKFAWLQAPITLCVAVKIASFDNFVTRTSISQDKREKKRKRQFTEQEEPTNAKKVRTAESPESDVSSEPQEKEQDSDEFLSFLNTPPAVFQFDEGTEKEDNSFLEVLRCLFDP